MKTFELGRYVVSFDPVATAKAYAALDVAGPEECGCWFCRNWIAVREEGVPLEVSALLQRFGVPVKGEIEVWETPGDSPGRHLYGGWYMIVGTVENRTTGECAPLRLGPWEVEFTSGCTYPVPAFGAHPVFEMHFLTESGRLIGGDPSDPL